MSNEGITGDPGAAEVIKLRQQPERYFGTEYAISQAPNTIDTFVRLGLHPSLVPIFKQHLNDLHLVVTENGQCAEGQSLARLDVQKITPVGSTKAEWRRTLIVSSDQMKHRIHELGSVLDEMDMPAVDKTKLADVVLDWTYYEQAVVALSNSYYMQRKFGRYIPDFDGQHPYHNAELEISTTYITHHPDLPVSIDEDARYLKEGFGLMMLHEVLLAHKILGNATQADWIITRLRKGNPAYRSNEIKERIRLMKPRKDIAKKILELAMQVEAELRDPE